MKRGIHFYVSIDVLVSFSISATAEIDQLPGKISRKTLKVESGETVTITTMPHAELFIHTLHASGAQVHVYGNWSTHNLHLILKLFHWSKHVQDTRSLQLLPGLKRLNLFCVGCLAAEVHNSVVVAPVKEEWHESQRQLVVVDHDSTHSWQHTSVEDEHIPLHSLDLLYALSRCIGLAEWRLRYPLTPLVCCDAILSSTVLHYCRFFVSKEAWEISLVLQIAAAGGVLVEEAADATHIVVTSGEDEDVSSSSSSSSSSDDDDSTSSVSSASDRRRNVREHYKRLNQKAVLVTREWIVRSCQASRALDVFSRHADNGGEGLFQLGVFLSSILPPPDAKPLPFAQFIQMANHYGFDTSQVERGVEKQSCVQLAKLYGGIMSVRQTNGEGYALCRRERKGERDAVSDHLAFTAGQYQEYRKELYARYAEHRLSDNGSQTYAPLLVNQGTSMDSQVVPDVPTSTEQLPAKVPNSVPLETNKRPRQEVVEEKEEKRTRPETVKPQVSIKHDDTKTVDQKVVPSVVFDVRHKEHFFIHTYLVTSQQKAGLPDFLRKKYNLPTTNEAVLKDEIGGIRCAVFVKTVADEWRTKRAIEYNGQKLLVHGCAEEDRGLPMNLSLMMGP
ncbi:hypothetical protein AGDE_12529 [Angomonas deanei]|uniref:BRCT domain-containing protein n=1 Tax=Angomonas deanei TaxID=59799 RepID=A0A7G2CDX5_9TRYP|nr:hypothetical protein AGDE_12529 [Angomonas deanei]CAD2217157.1 hypothetical protein, conserved [Angomonas deanei]|eukprot:EPY24068.1 hypothetical protein AGDE_12529 [Angomonas deanei]